MADFDRFEQPAYSDDLGGQEEGQKPLDIVTKNLGKIIAIIAVLAIAYFAYDFFAGSMRNITITAVDSEKNIVEPDSMQLSDESGKAVLPGAGQGNSFRVRKGTYTVAITAQGFKPFRDTISIENDGEIQLVLPKDIRVSIESVLLDETSIRAGQTVAGTISLENKGDKPAEVELLLPELDKKPIEGVEISIEPSKLSVPAKGKAEAAISITISDTIKIKNAASGDDKQTKIQVRFTNSTATLAFKVVPKLNIGFATAKISFGRMRAGANSSKEIQIKNGNNYPAKNLSLSLEIAGSANRDAEGWFTFIKGQKIDSIDSKGTYSDQLRVDVPITAKKETINGLIVLSGESLDRPIKAELLIEIADEAKIDLAYSIQTSVYSVKWLEAQQKYEEKTASFSLKNDSDLDIQNIQVFVKNPGDCTVEWLKLTEPLITEIKKGETKTVYFTASAPTGVRGTIEEVNGQNCRLGYKYENPLTHADEEEEIDKLVQINPSG